MAAHGSRMLLLLLLTQLAKPTARGHHPVSSHIVFKAILRSSPEPLNEWQVHIRRKLCSKDDILLIFWQISKWQDALTHVSIWSCQGCHSNLSKEVIHQASFGGELLRATVPAELPQHCRCDQRNILWILAARSRPNPVWPCASRCTTTFWLLCWWSRNLRLLEQQLNDCFVLFFFSLGCYSNHLQALIHASIGSPRRRWELFNVGHQFFCQPKNEPGTSAHLASSQLFCSPTAATTELLLSYLKERRAAS